MPHSTTLTASAPIQTNTPNRPLASSPTTLKTHPLLAHLHHNLPPPPANYQKPFKFAPFNTPLQPFSPRRRLVLTRTLSNPVPPRTHSRSKSLNIISQPRTPPSPPPPPPPPDRLVNESFTPPSPRSRSPSVSSLETIPDTPEDEIREEEEAEKERENGRKKIAEQPPTNTGGSARRTGNKRWSVCGAERRADLDLETIWEGGE